MRSLSLKSVTEVAKLEHLKTEHLVGAFRPERVFARLQAFVHLDSIQVEGEARDVDADGLGRMLGRELNLPAAIPGIELEELQALRDQLGGLQQEDGRRQRRLGGGVGAIDDVEGIVLFLLLLGLDGFGRDEVLGVLQIWEVRLGWARAGVLLGRS